MIAYVQYPKYAKKLILKLNLKFSKITIYDEQNKVICIDIC